MQSLSPKILGGYVWSLMRLRIGPQDLPATTELLALSAAIMLIANVVAATLVKAPGSLLLVPVVEVLFLAFFLQLLLIVFRFRERFAQTFSAMAMVQAGFVVLSIPLQYALLVDISGSMDPSLPPEQAFQNINGLVTLAYFVLFIWILRVFGHVLAHALDIKTVVAIAVGFTYMLAKAVVRLTIA